MVLNGIKIDARDFSSLRMSHTKDTRVRGNSFPGDFFEM
jgi:hypothetical protein